MAFTVPTLLELCQWFCHTISLLAHHSRINSSIGLLICLSVLLLPSTHQPLLLTLLACAEVGTNSAVTFFFGTV